jgi:hypothetical protein
MQQLESFPLRGLCLVAANDPSLQVSSREKLLFFADGISAGPTRLSGGEAVASLAEREKIPGARIQDLLAALRPFEVVLPNSFISERLVGDGKLEVSFDLLSSSAMTARLRSFTAARANQTLSADHPMLQNVASEDIV